MRATIVLPLKTVRLSADTAMDETDSMTVAVQKWFRLHTATNTRQLCFMLQEHVEEESVVQKLLESKDHPLAEILSKWMALDIHPEDRETWIERITRRHLRMYGYEKPGGPERSRPPRPTSDLAGRLTYPRPGGFFGRVEEPGDLRYDDHTVGSLERIEMLLDEHEKSYETTNDRPVLYKNGHVLFLYGHARDALPIFEKMHSLEGDRTVSLVHMGGICRELGDHDGAIRCWRESLSIRFDGYVLYHICDLLIELKRSAEGLSYLASIPWAAPDASQIISRGMFLMHLGYLDAAQNAFEELLSEMPDYLEANAMLGYICYLKKDFEKAAAHADRAIELYPEHPDGYYLKTQILFNTEPCGDLQDLYDKILEMDPNHDRAWVDKGSYLSNRGDFDEAVAYMKRGLKINPNNETGVLNMGITLCKMERDDEAEPYLDAILRADPLDAQANYRKSIIHSRRGSARKCLACLKRAIAANPVYREVARDEADDFARVADSKKFRRLLDGA